MNLLNRINKFYKHYDLVHDNTIILTKASLNDPDALMTAYETVWLTMEHYDDYTSAEYKWLLKLYNALNVYINNRDNKSTLFAKLCDGTMIFTAICLGFFINDGNIMSAVVYAIATVATLVLKYTANR